MHVSLRTLVPLLGRLTVSVGLVAASVALAPTASADPGDTGDTGDTAGTTATSGPTGDPTGQTGTDPTGTDQTGTDPTGTDPTGTDPTGTDPTGTDPTDPSGPTSKGTTPQTPQDPVVEPQAPTVQVDSGPARPGSWVHDATFTFHSDQADATYACAATLAGHLPDYLPCTSGVSYHGLGVGAWTFSVRGTAHGGAVPGVAATYTWNVFEVYSPDHYSVPAGATFNNPYGNTTNRRRNLTHVIRTINSMPGYRVASQAGCPASPTVAPSTIRISLYSATDMAFARALVAAARRCVSVQILMNNHLGPRTTPSIAYMQKWLGSYPFSGSTANRTFAHRCNYGCRGGGVLHSKFYLFDSSLVAPGGAPIKDTVIVGSSNMTSNAAAVQWNDLYTVRDAPTLHSQYLWMFDRMKRDRDERRTYSFTDGIYQSTFTPVTPGTADPTMGALRSIHCTGAAPGSGIAGHTVVYINMHAWFGIRGYGLAKQVRSMYARGCYVRILYSFMSVSVHKALTSGTGSRMSARRTIFPKRDRIHAKHYSHFKNIAANGYVGSNRSARVVWTGSNNFTNDGLKFDEVTLRIASASAYNQYVGHFRYMSATHSAPNYLKLLEPIGGGRAIDTDV
jgi:hypothetical protein